MPPRRRRGTSLVRAPSVVFVAVETAMIVAMFSLAPSGALMLCILYPHIWASLPNRQAAVMTVTPWRLPANPGRYRPILRWSCCDQLRKP